MTDAIKVEVDHELCYGAQNCSLVAPEAFEYDEDGRAVVADNPRATTEEYRQAEEGCPAMAIRVMLGRAAPVDDGSPTKRASH